MAEEHASSKDSLVKHTARVREIQQLKTRFTRMGNDGSTAPSPMITQLGRDV